MHQPKEIRDYLAQMWKIPRSGIAEIRDQEIISDGHTYEDLKVITHELMTEYIGSEESFLRAWEITVAKAHSELHPPIGEIRSAGEKVEVTPVDKSHPELGDKTLPEYLEHEKKVLTTHKPEPYAKN